MTQSTGRLTPAHEAAAVWRDRCLLRVGSVFTDQPLWVVPNLETVLRAFAVESATPAEAFRQKLWREREKLTPESAVVAAEAVWVLMLFPSAHAIGGDRKRELFRSIWPEHYAPPPEGPLMAALDHGIGHPGPAYIRRIDLEFGFLLELIARYKRMGFREAFTAPWRAAAFMDMDQGAERRPLRHVLLHLLFPEVFSGIIAAEHRKSVVSAFSDWLTDFPNEPSDTPLMRTDRQIHHIRQKLESERGGPIDFYDESIRALWQPAKPPPAPKKTKGATNIPAQKIVAEEPVQAADISTPSNTVAPGRFIIKTAFLNVRASPSPDAAEVLGSPLPYDTPVDVFETTGMWSRVTAPGPVNGITNVTGWILAHFLQPLVEGTPAEDPAAPAQAQTVEPAPPQLQVVEAAVARLVHDHVGSGRITLKDDRLNIAPEVKALCHVLIAEKSRPPISVGLFGDWGTGKSFFMESMYDYIQTLAEVSGKAVAEGRESAFCRHVVQIRFNAWHYMDSNLWASLAARIFDGLWEAVREKEPDTHQTLIQKLAESEGVLAEMESGRVAAQEEHTRHQASVERLTEERDAVQGRLGRQVGAAVRTGLQSVASDPGFLAAVGEAERLARLPAGSVTPEAVWARIAELRSRWGRVRALWASLGTGSRWLMAVAFLLVVLGVPALAILLSGNAALLASLGALAAGVSAVLARVGPWLSRVPAVIAKLEEANAVVQQQVRLEQEKERRQELADQQELIRLEQSVRQATEARDQAAARVEALRKEIDDVRAGRRIQRFLQERGASDDYRRHLGIVSLIRNDFEQLSTLLRGLENEGPQEGMPSIDRIVLYIDDLDRCPEQRVVAVLQAVHLLLAYPLFVVVVGVDSRWLLLSLEDHYSALRGRTRGRDGRTRRLSTPQNYLEKIFQIPFTLRPMEPQGFGKLMGSLVTVRAAAADGNGSPVDAENIQPPEAIAPNVTSNVIDLSADEHAAAPRTGDKFDEPVEDEHDGESHDEEAHEIDLTPPALELESWEVRFMGALHPLIGSPRSAKRFVNVYQFIRARQSGDALDRFRGTANGGQYQVAALLLAALVGFPRESRPLFSRLLKPGDTALTWWALVDEETAVPDPAAEGAEERIRFAGALQAVRAACTFPDTPELFREWAPTIARFSFTRTQSGGE